MAVSGVVQLDNLIPEMWASEFYDELRSDNSMLSLFFERRYSGVIARMGDTVRVNQIQKPSGEILTDDAQQFASEAMATAQFNIQANKRASAAFEFTDLADLQSQSFQQEAQTALVDAIREQMESDLLAALSAGPSASAPDHDIAPAVASDLEAVDLGTMRTLLSQAKVPLRGRTLFLDPQYYGDILDSTKVMSRDFVAGNNSEEGVSDRFMGFTIMEHNLFGADLGFACHPSALQVVMQQEIRLKISDLHPQNKYGYLMSADMVYGYTLADNKRYVKISG